MGSFAEYDQHDAIGLAALIAKREVSPLEVLDEAIARAEKYNPTINAITLKLDERARVAAGTVTASGPFAGVPFLLKVSRRDADRDRVVGVKQAVRGRRRRP